MKSNAATSISEPAAQSIDATRLDTYAQARNMAYQWRTLPQLGEWRGDVRMGERGGKLIWWTGRAESEQAALDRAIEMAIDYYDGKRCAGPGTGR